MTGISSFTVFKTAKMPLPRFTPYTTLASGLRCAQFPCPASSTVRSCTDYLCLLYLHFFARRTIIISTSSSTNTTLRCPNNASARAMASSSSSLVSFGQQHVTQGLERVVEDVFEKGEGSYVTMKSGRTMLDLTCGIALTNLGQVTFHRLSQ